MIKTTTTIFFIRCDYCQCNYRNSMSVHSESGKMILKENLIFVCPDCGKRERIDFTGKDPTLEMQEILNDVTEKIKDISRNNANSKN